MKVLDRAGKVRLRDERKQLRRRRVQTGERVVGNGGTGLRVEQSNGIGLAEQSREIASSLGRCGHGREDVVRIRTPTAAVVSKKEGFRTAFVDVRNIERASEGEAESILVVAGLVLGLAAQGKRLGVENRSAVTVEDRSVGPVDVKAAPAAASPSAGASRAAHRDDHRPSAGAAGAESTSTEVAHIPAAQDLKLGGYAADSESSAAAALLLELLAQVGEAVLHLSWIKQILLRASHGA